MDANIKEVLDKVWERFREQDLEPDFEDDFRMACTREWVVEAKRELESAWEELGVLLDAGEPSADKEAWIERTEADVAAAERRLASFGGCEIPVDMEWGDYFEMRQALEPDMAEQIPYCDNGEVWAVEAVGRLEGEGLTRPDAYATYCEWVTGHGAKPVPFDRVEVG